MFISFFDQCFTIGISFLFKMNKYLLFASLVAVGSCKPTLVDSGNDHFGGYGSDGNNGGWPGALILGKGADLGDIDEGGSSSYGSLDAHSGGGGGGGGGGGYIGGDFHHGVSIVGSGGGNKETILDLTDHAGEGHHGSFGGSFVASGKYSSGGHEGGDEGRHGGGYGGGYGISEGGGGGGFAEHYSDVLGASDSGGLGSHAGYQALSGSSFGGGDEGFSGYH